MDFVSVSELSQKWGITTRRVQQYCAEGKLAGAERVGKVWLVPRGVQRPDGTTAKRCLHFSLLDNISFYPSEADAVLSQEENGQGRKVMECELAYLRCEFGSALEVYRKTSLADETRLCVLAVAAGEAVATANFKVCREIFREFYHLKNHCQGDQLEGTMTQLTEHMFLAKMRAVEEELVLDNYKIPTRSFRQCLHLANGFYHYQCRNYQKVIGMMETLLSFQTDNRYTPKDLSVHLLCGLAYYKENDVENAVRHIERALDLGLPDGILMPFVDFLNDYGKLLEKRIRQRGEAYCKRIIEVCEESRNNWIRIHNLYMEKHYNTMLSRREHQIALMAIDGSTNKEIAEKMEYSVATVKKYLESVYEKTGINKRQDLKKYVI